jgi:hypothetical protein
MKKKNTHYKGICDRCGRVTNNLLCAKENGKHVADVCCTISPNNPPSYASCFELWMKEKA